MVSLPSQVRIARYGYSSCTLLNSKGHYSNRPWCEWFPQELCNKEAMNCTLPSFKDQVRHILLHSAFPKEPSWQESLSLLYIVYSHSVFSTRHFLPCSYCFMWIAYLSHQTMVINPFGGVLGPFENPIKDTNISPRGEKKKEHKHM